VKQPFKWDRPQNVKKALWGDPKLHWLRLKQERNDIWATLPENRAKRLREIAEELDILH